jgi:hypothetical protein
VRLPLTVVQEAIASRLATLGAPIYAPVAPQGAALPFAVIHRIGFEADPQKCWSQSRLTVSISIWCPDEFSLEQINELLSKANGLLMGSKLSLSDGYKHVLEGRRLSGSVETVEGDGKLIQHGIIEFELVVQNPSQ